MVFQVNILTALVWLELNRETHVLRKPYMDTLTLILGMTAQSYFFLFLEIRMFNFVFFFNTFLIGIGLVITAIIIGITNSMWCFIPFVVGFVVGLIMLIYAGIKYNC